MPDDLHRKGPQDVSRINLHEPGEVSWWCSEFHISQTELEEAVKAVGTESIAVRRYLGNR